MKLASLLNQFMPVSAAVRGANMTIDSLTDDSRLVCPGSIFVARSGSKSDGRAFVADAVKRGAAVILHTGEDPCAQDASAGQVLRVQLPDGTDLLRFSNLLAERLEGNPSEWLKLIGVTGTNGKTTLAYLVQQFIQATHAKCGVIGTVSIDDGASVEVASLTTPSGIETSHILARMVRNGCRACAMEVSSHALEQGRADALRFHTAVFTNLTGDHLDYHGTMEDYAHAKARLFQMLPADGVAIVNGDDPWHETMIERISVPVWKCHIVSDGAATTDHQCTAVIHAASLGWQDVTFTGPWGSVRTKLPIVGRHNAMNALQATAAAWSIGVPLSAISTTLASCQAPPGRLEPVTTPDDPFAVLVDYAHTDDALLNVLTALRPLLAPGGRLITVFGCGGDRDRSKRPRMMKVACEWSDRVVVTSDNPRTEDPESILMEVLAGQPADRADASAPAVAVTRQVDRALAIELAVSQARAGDIVLIAGKGHEDYQIIGTVKRPFDDRLVARRAMESAASRR